MNLWGTAHHQCRYHLNPVGRLINARTDLSTVEVQRQLWDGDPRIAVSLVGIHGLHLTPDTLESGEAEIVADRLKQILQ